MERLGEYVKRSILDFKLELCCFFASVRLGVMGFACLNILLGFITLITLAEGAFEPLLLKALGGMFDQDSPPNFVPICIVAYATELSSSVLLLCAIIRDDLVLLRAYLYFALAVLTGAVMVYSVVFFAVPISLELLLLCSLGYQCYLVLLVRSAMVEIKHNSVKNGYTVNLTTNDTDDTSGPKPLEKYSVVIEPDTPRRIPVIPITRQETPKAILATETAPKPLVRREISAPILIAQRELPVKVVPVKEAVIAVHSSKEEVAKTPEEKKEEVKKPSRSFFGRKERVKVEDSKAKLEKIEESKKV